MESNNENKETVYGNFINSIIEEDLADTSKVVTRFPPEPNGYLHLGHAKSICLNFGLAKQYGGKCNLRFDDTNPAREDTEFVNSIQNDIKWLGFDWEDRLFFASSYFDKMYEYAVELIKKGLAFVCDMNAEEVRLSRGTLTEPGKESPYRNRSIEENLELFEKMKNGVIIINTARGRLIDTDALIDALECGKVGGAGLDVLEHEDGLYYANRMGDVIVNRRMAVLRSFPNVILTPHTAFYSDIVVSNMAEKTIKCVLDMAEGKDNPNIIINN